MDPAHVEEQLAKQEPQKKAAGNHRIGKMLVLILVSGLVLPPVVGYQVKKWPWKTLADDVLEAAPGIQRLKLGIFPLTIVDSPGISFDYETRFDSGPTHHHFNQRLASLGFKRRQNGWNGPDRHAYFYSEQRAIACNIVWRSGETACLPGYRRQNCDPSVNVVRGQCSSTSREKPGTYERIAGGIIMFAGFELARASMMVEKLLGPNDRARAVQ